MFRTWTKKVVSVSSVSRFLYMYEHFMNICVFYKPTGPINIYVILMGNITISWNQFIKTKVNLF